MSGMSGLEHSSYECRDWRVSNEHKFNVLALEPVGTFFAKARDISLAARAKNNPP